MEVRNQRGQTVVEYILLLAVAVSLVATFYNSKTFQNLFGDKGMVGQLYKREGEWGYRHAYTSGKDPQHPTDVMYTSAHEHPSYFNSQKSDTRFFGPSDPYR